MDGVRFSLLVPVYNTEKYLDDFFRSVQNQTYKNFEVIVIDDGSTDGSGMIADTYAENDRRFRVWHTSNNGTLRARKTAQEKATGNYLLNVDSDDILAPRLFETLAAVINKHGSDLVMFDFTSFFPDGREKTETYFDGERVFEGVSKEEIIRLLLTTRLNSLCTKCYGRKIAEPSLDYAKFHGLRHGEDLLISSYLLFNAEKIVYINAPLYRYRIGVGMSAKFEHDSLEKSSMVLDVIHGLLKEHGFLTDETEAEFFCMCRKQMNNYIGLMVKTGIHAGEAVMLLKKAEGLTVYRGAVDAVCDRYFGRSQNFKFSLLRRKKYRLLLAVQSAKQRLFNNA